MMRPSTVGKVATRHLRSDADEIESAFGPRGRKAGLAALFSTPTDKIQGLALDLAVEEQDVSTPVASASFNPGISIANVHRATETVTWADLLRASSAPLKIYSNTRAMLEELRGMTKEQLDDFLLHMQPPPMEPRAQENNEPLGEDLKLRFPLTFREKFMAGSMSLQADEWERQLGEDHFVTKMVRDGVGFLFKTSPERQYHQYFLQYTVKIDNRDTGDPEDRAWARGEIKKLEEAGCIKNVTKSRGNPAVVRRRLPVFVIRQGEKRRLVWDARNLNEDILCDTFTMETIDDVARMVQPGQWMFTLDARSGYHQMLLQHGHGDWKRDLRPDCCFEIDDCIYQWQVTPFGLKNAPWSYQKTMLALFEIWRKDAVQCSSYIDDGLWAADTVDETVAVRDRVLQDMERFGIQVHPEKARLVPAQAVRFLGTVVDSSGKRVRLFVPDDKLERMMTMARKLFEGPRGVEGAAVASFVGTILSMRLAFPLARVMSRSLLADLRQLPLRRLLVEGREVRARDYSKSVTLSEDARNELRWFAVRAKDFNGAEWFHTTATRTLTTDASSEGAGAIARAVEGDRESTILAWSQRELLLDENSRGSVRTELEATLHALIDLADHVEGETVLHQTDSVATYYGLLNGGYAVGANSELNVLIKKIAIVCMLAKIKLVTRYIGSDGIIRSGADLLSRDLRDDRTCLRADVFEKLRESCCSEGINLQVDLFAESGRNAGGLPFYTRHVLKPEPAGWQGADALARPWHGCVYAFPPLGLLDVVVEKAVAAATTLGCTTVLVAPLWPQRMWHAKLMKEARGWWDLGRMCDVTETPEGASRAIESDATYEATMLRAFIIGPR